MTHIPRSWTRIALRSCETGLPTLWIPDAEPVLTSRQSSWRYVRLERYRVTRFERPATINRHVVAGLCLRGVLETEYRFCSHSERVKARHEAGRIFLHSPGELPAQYGRGDLDFLVVEIPSFFFEEAAAEDRSEAVKLRSVWAAGDRELQSLLQSFLDELLQNCPQGSLFEEYLCLSFARSVLSRHSALRDPLHGKTSWLSSAERRAGCALLNQGIRQEQSLFDLADALDLPPLRFVYGLKNSCGLFPHEYLARRRIECALRMLKQPGIKIETVAQESGFLDCVQFSAAFGRITGVSPNEYRDRISRTLNRVDLWQFAGYPHLRQTLKVTPRRRCQCPESDMEATVSSLSG